MKFLINIFLVYYVKGYISKDSSSIMIEYYLRKGVQKIELIYNYKGKDYPVGFHRNIYPERELRDTILWVTKDKWRKNANLKLRVYYDRSGFRTAKVKEYFISGKELIPYDFKNCRSGFKTANENLIKIGEGYYINPSLIREYQGPDKYSWRMLGYDAQHTGYYPFVLYPPLELKWAKDWSGSGIQITEVSACAGYGMLFIPNAPDELNFISAVDMETGQIIWKRELTANAMTSVLSEGDSILFVGTWIGFNPDSDTTFYALDPFTGELKWGKTLKSVQSQPIVVDSFIYVPSYGLSKIFAFTYRGDSLWSVSGGGVPAYYNGTIFHKGGGFLQARNYITGDSIWYFEPPAGIIWLSIYKNNVFFSTYVYPYAMLYSLNIFDGEIRWKIDSFPISALLFTFTENFIIVHRCYWGNTFEDTVWTQLYQLDPSNGCTVWTDSFSNGRAGPGSGLVTDGNFCWLTGQWIYLIDSDKQIVVPKIVEVPGNYFKFNEGNRFFPIVYKNYFIGAHERSIYIYTADTLLPSSDTPYTFKFYPYYNSGESYIYLLLPQKEKISLDLFDISGRKILNLYKGYMEKGEHFLPLSGVQAPGGYFVILKTDAFKKAVKIIKIKRR